MAAVGTVVAAAGRNCDSNSTVGWDWIVGDKGQCVGLHVIPCHTRDVCVAPVDSTRTVRNSHETILDITPPPGRDLNGGIESDTDTHHPILHLVCSLSSKGRRFGQE